MYGTFTKVSAHNAKTRLTESYNSLLKDISSTVPQSIGNYHILEPIGEGSFGKAYLAYHVLTKVKVVLKASAKKQSSNLVREIQHHRNFRHPHITKLYEIIITENNVWLVLEYCREDELYNYLLKNGRLDVEQASRIFSQLVGAVAYVHQNHCAHRDLKLENILLDKRLNVKLTDFGFTREYEQRSLLETICGTTCYMAPELLLHKKYSGEAIDVWSLGIILYTLLEGEMPFEEDNDSDTRKKIIEDEPRFPQNDITEEALELINKMLSKDPKRRPTVMEILNDPFLSEYSQTQLDILQFTPSKPFSTKSERRLLRKLRSAHIDVDTLIKSVNSRKCDALSGTWELALEREIKSEASKHHRASINLSKYSLTKSLAAGYEGRRSRSSSKGPGSRPSSRAVSVDSTTAASPRSPKSPLARLSGSMRPSLELAQRDGRRSASISSTRRREFSTTSVSSQTPEPVIETTNEQEPKPRPIPSHVSSPLSQSSPSQALAETSDYVNHKPVQDPKQYVVDPSEPDYDSKSLDEDTKSFNSTKAPSTSSTRHSLNKTLSKRSSIFSPTTKISSSALRRLMTKINPLRKSSAKSYENSLGSGITDKTESDTIHTVESSAHSGKSPARSAQTGQRNGNSNTNGNGNGTVSNGNIIDPPTVPGINVQKNSMDNDSVSASVSQRTNSFDTPRNAQLNVSNTSNSNPRPRPTSQISQLSAVSQASQYSINSQMSSVSSQISRGSAVQRRHSASSSSAKKSRRPFYNRRSTSSSFSSIVSNQKKHHSKTSSTSSTSPNASPTRQSSRDFSGSKYDHSIASFESTSSTGASFGTTDRSAHSSTVSSARSRFNESAVFTTGRSSTPMSKTRRKSAFAEAFSSLNPSRKSRAAAPMLMASRTSVIVEHDELQEDPSEAVSNSQANTDNPQNDSEIPKTTDDEERGRRM